MKRKIRLVMAFVMALVMTASVVSMDGQALLEGVYFSAADEQLLELTKETMPFYYGDELYISSKFFEGTDLDVRYVRNTSMGLAVLYTTKKDLRFDLVNRKITDKAGKIYSGRAIEKSGNVFFPIDLVCQYFGLSWSMSATETVPLIRIRSPRSLLSNHSFIDVASSQMASRYAAYEKQESSAEIDAPPIQAAEGQKVYLILSSETEETTRKAMEILGDHKATFLLTVEQMAQADLLRALIGSGHGVALLARETSEEGVREEILRAREQVWDGTCSLLQQVWYEGSAEIGEILAELGCVRVTAALDRRDHPVRSKVRADALLTLIGHYKEDISVYLGADGECIGGLGDLIDYLVEAEFGLSEWRLTTKCS